MRGHPSMGGCASLEPALHWSTAEAAVHLQRAHPYPRCQQRAVKQLICMSPVLLEGSHHCPENADERQYAAGSIAPPEQSVSVLSRYLEFVPVSWSVAFAALNLSIVGIHATATRAPAHTIREAP